jgi:MutS domain III
VSHEKPDAICQLDASTALALRVISDRGDGGKIWSLYSTIEPHLKLKAGRRLLRASLLQPLISQPTILERQNTIAELISMPDVQAGLQEFLQSIPPGVHQCLPALSQVVPDTNKNPMGGNPNGRLKAPTRLIQAVLKIKTILVEMQVLLSWVLLCLSS